MTRRRFTRPRPVDAAVLAVVGAIALIASTTFHGSPLLEVSGSPVPVNAGARDPGDIDANNSPALARNPTRPANLAVVNRVDTPRYTCRLGISQDGGARWSSVALAIPRGEERKCFAPDLTFAADGTLYVSYVTLRGTANEPHAVWLARSVDGGRTLQAPRRVAGPLAFGVRVTTDPRHAERVYVTWLAPDMVGLYLFSGTNNRIVLARSDDRGAHFRRPVRVSDTQRTRVLAPAPAVGPDGALYVLYLDLGDDTLDYEGGHDSTGGPPYRGRFSLVLGRSTDGGATWQQSLVDDRIVPTRRFIAFLPPVPSLAIDRDSGRIYVAFEDGRASPSDVLLWSLARGASTWRGPTRVNDTPARDRSWQYLPAIAVAPDGRLDVVYYDRRDDPANRRNSVSIQSSSDAGRTFTAHARLSDRDFDARIGAGSERGLPDLGSRLGLVAGPDGAFAAWTDTRAGSVDSNKQDIAFARAQVARAGQLPPSARTGLRFGGLALLLAALGLVLVPRPRRR